MYQVFPQRQQKLVDLVKKYRLRIRIITVENKDSIDSFQIIKPFRIFRFTEMIITIKLPILAVIKGAN